MVAFSAKCHIPPQAGAAAVAPNTRLIAPVPELIHGLYIARDVTIMMQHVVCCTVRAVRAYVHIYGAKAVRGHLPVP